MRSSAHRLLVHEPPIEPIVVVRARSRVPSSGEPATLPREECTQHRTPKSAGLRCRLGRGGSGEPETKAAAGLSKSISKWQSAFE